MILAICQLIFFTIICCHSLIGMRARLKVAFGVRRSWLSAKQPSVKCCKLDAGAADEADGVMISFSAHELNSTDYISSYVAFYTTLRITAR